MFLILRKIKLEIERSFFDSDKFRSFRLSNTFVASFAGVSQSKHGF